MPFCFPSGLRLIHRRDAECFLSFGCVFFPFGSACRGGFLRVQKQQEYADQSDCPESHTGPVIQGHVRPESNKCFGKALIKRKRIETSPGRLLRSSRILSKPQEDGQQKTCSHGDSQNRPRGELKGEVPHFRQGFADAGMFRQFLIDVQNNRGFRGSRGFRCCRIAVRIFRVFRGCRCFRGCCGFRHVRLFSSRSALSPCCQHRKQTQVHGPPDRVDHGHHYQHVEKIKIADTGQKNRGSKQSSPFSPKNMLCPQKKERKPYHGIQKIGMAHAEHGKAAEHIDQGSAEIAGQSAVSHVSAVSVKTEPGQIHPDRDHGIVKSQHVLLRHQDGGQAEGISDHIVLQSCEKIRAITHVQVKGRKRRMPRQNAFQDSPPPPRVIAERRKVLGKSVSSPDHSLACHGKVPENQCS